MPGSRYIALHRQTLDLHREGDGGASEAGRGKASQLRPNRPAPILIQGSLGATMHSNDEEEHTRTRIRRECIQARTLPCFCLSIYVVVVKLAYRVLFFNLFMTALPVSSSLLGLGLVSSRKSE